MCWFGIGQTYKKLTNSNVVYENRRASFGEIAKQVCLSKYVLFPYVGNSISSSGALIDTLVLVELLLVLIKVHLKIWRKKVYVLRIKWRRLGFNIAICSPKLKVEKFISDNTWEKFARVIWEFFNIKSWNSNSLFNLITSAFCVNLLFIF